MNRFRTKLLLDEQRIFFDMWQKACSGFDMPSRKAISPCQFSSLLPYVSLFEIGASKNEIKVIVAGSGLRDILGDDPKKAFLSENIDGGINAIEAIKLNAAPICGVAKSNEIGRTGIVRFWMRLPLGFDNHVNGAIGLDISLSGARAPLWAIEQMKSSLAS